MEENKNSEEIDVFEADGAKAYARLTKEDQEQEKDDFDFEGVVETPNSLPNSIQKTAIRPQRRLPSISVTEDLPGSPIDVVQNGLAARSSISSSSLRSSLVSEQRKNLTDQALLVYGPPGGTKSSLVRRLVAEMPAVFTRVVSHTTRQQLASETNGKDYYFVSREEFKELVEKSELLEHTQVTQVKHRDIETNRYTKASTEHIDEEEISEENSFGTTERALLEARRVGSPCVVMVLDLEGAKHWLNEKEKDKIDVKLHFVFVRNVRSFCHPLDLFHSKVIVDNDLEEAFVSLKSAATVNAVKYEDESPKAKMLAAQAEWSAVETIQPGKTGSVDPVLKTRLVTFSELLNYFQTIDLSHQMENIRPVLRRSGLSAIAHTLFAPKLSKSLHKERNLVFAMALYGFNNSQLLHIRVLQTIYRKLAGANLDCARFGNHWQVIGFQGTDPATDLRGTGFLGLVHLIYLVMDPQRLKLTLEIFRLSQDKIQNFPFCALSINVTRIALQSLREGVLTRECNKRQEVLGVLNEFYAATLYHLYFIWRHQKKTITDTGFVLRDVESWVKKNPKKVVQNLSKFLAAKQSANKVVSSQTEDHEDDDLHFSKIGDINPTAIDGGVEA
eukprot:m.161237 g.161237  ORF g.161237 m.161237 type:complete len:615 (+) comp38808_c0_seq5:29-1873(+)